MTRLNASNGFTLRPAAVALLGALLMLLADTGTVACNTPQETAQASATPTPSTPNPSADVSKPSAAPTASPEAKAIEPSESADSKPPEEDPPLPPPLHFDRVPPVPIQTGWAVLTEKADTKARAWIEGSIVSGDRLTINTENVRRFTLDLTRLRLNWQKRIVLRMDGFNSQLTKKRWPKLSFVRTAAGAWDVVDE